jgi:hypothetical protein
LDLLPERLSFGNIWVGFGLCSSHVPDLTKQAQVVHLNKQCEWTGHTPDQTVGMIDISDVQERPLIALTWTHHTVLFAVGFALEKHLSETCDEF